MAKKIIVILILLLGLGWRLYRLADIPSGIYVDEAVIGYNAYSLSLTGKDEYGVDWPVFLRSFGAFSSPMYTYLTTGVVKVMGLSNISVRLVSVIAGSMMMVWFYLILREFEYRWSIRVAGLLLMAISPWSVFLSRIALEGHLALSLATLSILAFLKSRRDRRWWIAVGLSLALSSWSYQAARLISWGLGAGFIWLGWKDWRSKWLIGGVALFLISQIPQLLLITAPAFSQRGVGLFYHNVNDKFREFWSQAAAYLSPLGLFWRGDEDLQRSMPGISNFFSFLVIFYLPGWTAVGRKLKSIEGKLFLLMLIVGIVVPALTKDPFSSVRGQFLIVPLMMVMVWGVEWWRKQLGNKALAIYGLLMVLSLLWLWRSLIVLLPYERAAAWSYGYRQIADLTKQFDKEKIVVEQIRQHPVYIELLYYLKFSPTEFHQTMGDWSKRYYLDTHYELYRKFGNIEVRNIDWKTDIYIDQILVGDELSISDGQANEHFLSKMFEVKDPTGKILFRGYRTNPTLKKLSRKIAGHRRDL